MKMLRCRLVLSLLWLAMAPAAWAQIIGYFNLFLFPGDNLIANQLGTRNDTLDNVLASGVLDGTTLTKWDPLADQFLPISTYSAATATWSINYSLSYGEGALLHSPSRAMDTFVGEIDPNLVDARGEVTLANWHPGYASGLYLLSCPVPFDGASFEEVVGRAPLNGEWVESLNEATQTYSLTTFHTGTGWDHGAPSVAVGHSAFFDLGPVTVPEPSTLALVTLGLTMLIRFRGHPSH